jgi:flagellar protein FliO/FliZ
MVAASALLASTLLWRCRCAAVCRKQPASTQRLRQAAALRQLTAPIPAPARCRTRPPPPGATTAGQPASSNAPGPAAAGGPPGPSAGSLVQTIFALVLVLALLAALAWAF